jgi:hypothetical protein
MQLIGADGKPIDVADADVPKAFLEQGAGLAAGTSVPMVAPNGQVGHVPAEKAQEAFASGARVATPEEIHKADIHHDYDNFAGYLAAGAAEAGNQAMLGAGDALALGAAKTFGGDKSAAHLKQTLNDLREENPTATAIGGVAGALAPALATGGAGELAEGAELAEGGSGLFGAVKTALGAPGRALEGAGGLAEDAARAALPDHAATLTGRIAQGAAMLGARGAAEGALLNAGNELSEEMLGDPELSGERLLAALGHGALLGGATGGLLATTGELGREVLGRLRPTLDRAAGEQAFRALNPERRFVKLAEKIDGGAEGVGKELLDRGIIEAGDKIDEIAPKVAAARREAGEKLGEMLGDMDALGEQYAPKAESVIDRVRREVIEPLSKLPGYKSEVSAVREYLQDFAQKTTEGLSFTGLRDIRAALDDKIFRGSNALNPSPVMKELQKMRSIVEDEIEAGGDRAADKLGADFRKQYKAAKLSYRRLSVADQAAENATAALVANRVVSPSDYLAGIAGFAGGGIHGGLAGMAMGAVHHVVRERGNSTAAILLKKASVLGAIQRATNAVDTEVNRGIAGILEPGKRAPVKVREAPFAKADEPHVAHANAVVGATIAPDVHSEAIERAVAPIADHAPSIANAFQKAALRTTMGLANSVPRGHLPPPSITPQFDKPIITDNDKQAFELERSMSHDPVGTTFSLAAKGMLTKSAVDTFQRNSPALYQDVVARTQKQLATLKKPLSSSQEQQIRVLMGMPAADPKLASILAQTYVSAPGQEPNQGPKAKGPKATPKQREGLADRERLAGLNEGDE